MDEITALLEKRGRRYTLGVGMDACYCSSHAQNMVEARLRGPVGAKLRLQVLWRDGFRCVRCGSEDNPTADHIYPRSKGGYTELDNLQTLCGSCNSSKGDKVYDASV